MNDGTNTSNVPTRTINLAAALATHLVVVLRSRLNRMRAGFGLTVAVEDSAGGVVTAFSGSVTVALANNPGSSTLSGTLTVTAANGVAKFAGLSLNRPGAGYTLSIASASLASVTTSAINVTPGAATQLVISSQPPTSVTAGAGFGLSVLAEDAQGNVVPTFSGSVTAALANNPGTSTLAGTTIDRVSRAAC